MKNSIDSHKPNLINNGDYMQYADFIGIPLYLPGALTDQM